MSTLCKIYPSEIVARKDVEALKAAGVPGRDIRLLTGFRLHDVREEPVGTFADAIAPDAPIGSFASVRRSRRSGRGSFASVQGPRRQGSFADTDLDVIVSYDNGARHSRVVGDLRLRRLLLKTTLTGTAGETVVDQLHAGHAVVLAEIAPRDARARLKDPAQAA